MLPRVFGRYLAISLLHLSLALSGCGGDDGSSAPVDAGAASDGGGGGDAGGGPPRLIGPEDRQARVAVPAAHDGVTELPLVVLLHGYSASSYAQDAYFGLSRYARTHGFYVVLPDGTVDAAGNRFWNATEACCNSGGIDVDDEGYLRGLVHEMKSLYPVDDSRVYFVGHSNGGFMSYRMACAMADEVTAIASLAGSTYGDASDCGASEPVSVLQVHGTADTTIAYDGGVGYPSAPDTVARWAERAGCDTSMPTDLEPLDIEVDLAGAETAVRRFETGCADGLDAELWSIEGGSHIPVFNDNWMPMLTEWLFRHSK